MTPLLQVEQLRVSYGELEVIKGVDLAVAPGETFAVIGPNGAGKTTLFKAITGEVAVSSGVVVNPQAMIEPTDRGFSHCKKPTTLPAKFPVNIRVEAPPALAQGQRGRVNVVITNISNSPIGTETELARLDSIPGQELGRAGNADIARISLRVDCDISHLIGRRAAGAGEVFKRTAVGREDRRESPA